MIVAMAEAVTAERRLLGMDTNVPSLIRLVCSAAKAMVA